jgi:hypothetical protein
MTPSNDQRPQSARRLGPRARSLGTPRFNRPVKNEYPVGYLAQLARPFTSRRSAGEGGPGGSLREGSLHASVR